MNFKYCRQCGYNLHMLMTPRCPECGRDFDPNDATTYLARPLRRLWRGLRWLAVVLLGAGLLMAGSIGWLYRGWQKEQKAIAMLRRGPCQVAANCDSIGPRRLKWILGEKHGYMLERVDHVLILWSEPSAWPSPGLDSSAMKSLAHLRRLEILEVCLTAKDAAAIAQLDSLRQLSINGARVDGSLWRVLGSMQGLDALDLTFTNCCDDAALRELASPGRLRSLTLDATGVTDEGMSYLRSCSALEELSLRQTSITDEGVGALCSLSGLKSLSLSGTRITDRSLGHLARMSNLRFLEIADTAVSVQAVEEFRRAQPEIKVECAGARQ